MKTLPKCLVPEEKAIEINKALKGSFTTQNAKNPQGPYNTWTVKSCAEEQILPSLQHSLSEQQFKDLRAASLWYAGRQNLG